MEKENQEYITDNAEIEIEKERQREQEQREAARRAKKRKLIPSFVMLFAGAVTSITMYALHYNLKDMLIVLVWVLLGFYIAGELIKWMLDKFEAQIEQKRMEEGEVIEKELEGEDGAAEAVSEEGGE